MSVGILEGYCLLCIIFILLYISFFVSKHFLIRFLALLFPIFLLVGDVDSTMTAVIVVVE